MNNTVNKDECQKMAESYLRESLDLGRRESAPRLVAFHGVR